MQFLYYAAKDMKHSGVYFNPTQHETSFGSMNFLLTFAARYHKF